MTEIKTNIDKNTDSFANVLDVITYKI